MKETITIDYEEEGVQGPLADEKKRQSYVVLKSLAVPGSHCEIWCYEGPVWKADDHHLENNRLVLTHHLAQTTIKTIVEPAEDGAEFTVEVSGPDKESVQQVEYLEPCWQLKRADNFGHRGDPENYVKDFVARCFVFLDRGLTCMNDTRRLPAKRYGNDLLAKRANAPITWTQDYFPTWRKHPGQEPGQRLGRSTDRPVYPIIGCISRDNNYLVAWAWPQCGVLNQAWIDCLHPVPQISESYDPSTNTSRSRSKIYFLPNDEERLLQAFKRDFPDWKIPANPLNCNRGPDIIMKPE